MESWWLTHASGVGRGLLVVAFFCAAVWETCRPRRALAVQASKRWFLNILLLFLSGLAQTFVFRVSGVILAIAVASSPYGLLNHIAIPLPLLAVVTFLLLDLVQYGDHYLRHAVPVLWRFHQVHHSDRDFDFSTGLRFHPGEALFTQAVYLLFIAAAAPPATVVLCFEAVNQLQAFFSHANVKLPAAVERMLSLFQITPRVHEIHHSRHGADQRSNYGVIFSFWDRLFRTYRVRSNSGEDAVDVGLSDVTPANSTRMWSMLVLPFASSIDSVPATRAASFPPTAPSPR